MHTLTKRIAQSGERIAALSIKKMSNKIVRKKRFKFKLLETPFLFYLSSSGPQQDLNPVIPLKENKVYSMLS